MSLEPHQFPTEIPIELENRAKSGLYMQFTNIFSEGGVLLIDGTQFALSDFGCFPDNPIKEILLNRHLKNLRASNQNDLADNIRAVINQDSRISMLKAFVVMPQAIERLGFIRVDYSELRPSRQTPLHGNTLGRKPWSKSKVSPTILPLIAETPDDGNNLLNVVADIANKRKNKTRSFMQHWTVNYLETNFPELKNSRQMNRIGREVFLGLAQQQLGDLTELFKNGQLHGQFLFNF